MRSINTCIAHFTGLSVEPIIWVYIVAVVLPAVLLGLLILCTSILLLVHFWFRKKTKMRKPVISCSVASVMVSIAHTGNDYLSSPDDFKPISR